jgi:hypothetical protein
MSTHSFSISLDKISVIAPGSREQRNSISSTEAHPTAAEKNDGREIGWAGVFANDVAMEPEPAKDSKPCALRGGANWSSWRPWKSSKRTVTVSIVETPSEITPFDDGGAETTSVNSFGDGTGPSPIPSHHFATVANSRAATPWPATVEMGEDSFGDENECIPGAVEGCEDEIATPRNQAKMVDNRSRHNSSPQESWTG